MIVMALMLRRQKAVAACFERAGAISAGAAMTPAQLQLTPKLAWHQLVAGGVLSCPGAGRYYLNEAKWLHWQRRQRRASIGMVVGVLLVIVVLLVRHQHG